VYVTRKSHNIHEKKIREIIETMRDVSHKLMLKRLTTVHAFTLIFAKAFFSVYIVTTGTITQITLKFPCRVPSAQVHLPKE